MSSQDPAARLAQKLIAMAQIWRREIARALTELGMSDAVALPLIHLRRDGDGVTQRCLAARVGVDNSSLVRVLDALEQSGDIQRVADPTDRRANLIDLTEQGHRTADRIEDILSRIRQHYLDGVDPLDLAAMDRALSTMLANHDSQQPSTAAPPPQD
ncbi:MarR family winged helix-turn-helix transcriptional regulator [Paracoccus sp. CPCC 101403]|uniref:MarR family winged helix-turn-helix transcriptional regulator n=2 Tax=Paracoccus broussonetiae TaxID=3075834 RepID=A0ABU3EL67_9RHOB|nr:MarR family winged helix-turn-helix transcriptional regulator [Paracoccus sp. CPCC 101403]MDT1064537.1 MarR family winged helix-turn-helix transcriptional regulator [Paracoccus sp. CPCC 101403]